jgi:hypothetical protein
MSAAMAISARVSFLFRGLKAAASDPRPINVCLWHAGRCGSTVLAELIGQSGQFNWWGEYFEQSSKRAEEQGENPDIMWSTTLRELKNQLFLAGARPLGIEFKLWHAYRLKRDIPTVLRSLQALGFSSHVILERRNYLRIYLSGRVRVASGISHTTDARRVFSSQIHIDPERALDEVRRCDEYYRQLKGLLPHSSFYLCYEDHLFADPTVGYNMFLRHFGYPITAATPMLKKTNARDPRELVTNWPELAAAFRDSPYAWMITD